MGVIAILGLCAVSFGLGGLMVLGLEWLDSRR